MFDCHLRDEHLQLVTLDYSNEFILAGQTFNEMKKKIYEKWRH